MLQAGADTPDGFIGLALANPNNSEILDRFSELQTADTWLVAGCLYQSVWNQMDCRPPTEGIKDYDIFYFDGDDLSYEAEDRVIRRAAALFVDLGVNIEVRNQARVHLWYEKRFAAPCLPLRSSADGMNRFPVKGTCVGMNAERHLYAPYGLEDLANGILRPNPLLANPPLFEDKARSYRDRWPWLHIVG